MDSGKRPLKVVYADAAWLELRDIWSWNARKNGRDHASAYVRFLEDGIAALATEYNRGQPEDEFPGIFRMTYQQTSRRDGHVAIYEVDESVGIVSVLHIYHTKQDIESRLRESHS